MSALATLAEQSGTKFILALFVDLRGKPCAKLVPVSAVDLLATEGVGLAGYAVGAMGQEPKDPDMMAIPDAASFTPIPFIKARCGISMKGVDIVVGGDVGHMSAFMAQAGRLEIRGNAGEALGDSIYETRLYVRGDIASLGADCVAKEMRPEHHKELEYLLTSAGFEGDDTAAYTRYGSARNLYHFHVDNTSSYS